MTASARRSVHPLWLLALAVLALCAWAPSASAHGDWGHGHGHGHGKKVVGVAYSETNGVPNNAVIVYNRMSDGTLEQREVVPTGGSGERAPQPGCEPPGGCPILDTQGEVIVTRDGEFVFAVNAGSNSVSVFRETHRGLKLVDVEPSNGDFPNSVTVHKNVLYVLNSHSNSIAGFKFDWRGDLRPISNSVRPLSAPASAPGLTPRQIGFDKTGKVLAVTLLTPLPGSIDTFVLDRNDRPGTANPNTPTTPLPFGFEFDNRNNLVMSQVSAPPELGLPGNTATYDLDRRTGDLTPIDTETSAGVAPCWVVVTNDGRHTFVVNTGGGPPGPQFAATIARYRLHWWKSDLTFLGLTPENNAEGDEFARTDEALSRDSRFLYVLKPGIFAPNSQIDMYRVERDGNLTFIGNTPPVGPEGQSGLAAR
jgi:6-phosphogluconolactonase (cycloisomerase 2 family)